MSSTSSLGGVFWLAMNCSMSTPCSATAWARVARVSRRLSVGELASASPRPTALCISKSSRNASRSLVGRPDDGEPVRDVVAGRDFRQRRPVGHQRVALVGGDGDRLEHAAFGLHHRIAEIDEGEVHRPADDVVDGQRMPLYGTASVSMAAILFSIAMFTCALDEP